MRMSVRPKSGRRGVFLAVNSFSSFAVFAKRSISKVKLFHRKGKRKTVSMRAVCLLLAQNTRES